MSAKPSLDEMFQEIERRHHALRRAQSRMAMGFAIGWIVFGLVGLVAILLHGTDIGKAIIKAVELVALP